MAMVTGSINTDYFGDSSSDKRAMERMHQEQLRQLYGMAQAQSVSNNVFIQSGIGVTSVQAKTEEPKPNPVLLLLEDL
jgi:primosomal protein N'